MEKQLQGKKVAILVADGFEQIELSKPKEALEIAGAQVDIISEKDSVQGYQGFEKADLFHVDVRLLVADTKDYDALVLPGGVHNPDTLRQNPQAIEFVKEFIQDKKPVAAICHAPWTLIEAGVVAGKLITSYPSLKTDLQNAGAKWVDQEVVVDQGLITSRNPNDLPAFCKKIVVEFSEDVPQPQVAMVKKVSKLIRNIRVAMLTTKEPNGSLRSRPMATQLVDFDGILWFFTRLDSAKSNEISWNQQVNLSYTDVDEERYVSLSGKAQLVRDRAKAAELWNPLYKVWFPEGLDDPKLTLLRVEVEQAEYWDAPARKMVTLFELARSWFTGKPYQMVEQEYGKLNFQAQSSLS